MRKAILLMMGAVMLMFASAAMAKQHKKEICHVPPDNPDNAHTITVPESAVSTHLEEHGDIACSCDVIDDCEAQGGALDEENCDCIIEGCFTDGECLVDEFCRFDVGSCQGPGDCRTIPPFCPLVFDPVCGCDGNTYTNDCVAAASGVSVDFPGVCPPP